jgi:uncharacterized protein (DUF342 family)
MDNVLYSKSGNVCLKIDDDKLSAWITLSESGQMIDEQEILDLIEEAGICYGFENALAWMADNAAEKEFGKPFPVAICKPSQSEQKLNFHFDLEHTYHPEQNWTLKDAMTWTFVERGSVLADMSYNLFTEGGSIYNIYGELTANPTNAIDLSLYLGSNVKCENDSIIAEITGYPFVDKENKIYLIDDLTYTGDIANTTTPITLAASLTVNGSITGANLSILKNLSISGDIKRAEVYTEGNLELEGDIIECQTTGVVVLGDLKVKSILDSLVVCKGTLQFSNFITGSRVIAEQQLQGDISNGTVYGSQVLTSGSVDVASIGNSDETETEIEITISPYSKERMTHLTKALIKLKDSPAQNADRIDSLNKELQELENNLSNDLNYFLNHDNRQLRYIKVHRDIYPGVYIRILKRAFTIKSYQEAAEFTEE